MTVLVDRANDDQPYVEATTVLGGAGSGNHRVYVPSNDTSQRPTGNTASVDQSGNAGTAAPPAGSACRRGSTRAPTAVLPTPPGGSQDGPSVRVAIHPQGRIYARLLRLANVRDTHEHDRHRRRARRQLGVRRGRGDTDPSDALAGVLVVTGSRRGALSSIWGPSVSARGSRSRSTRGSRTSSTSLGAMARQPASPCACAARSWGDSGKLVGRPPRIASQRPVLAINSRGRVGLLYQRLITGRTVGRPISRRPPTIHDDHGHRPRAGSRCERDVHRRQPDRRLRARRRRQGLPRRFCGFNPPVTANFPRGSPTCASPTSPPISVCWRATTVPVGVSIDPFFFHVSALAAGDDFYVRDWTDSPTSGDNGVEPSIASRLLRDDRRLEPARHVARHVPERPARKRGRREWRAARRRQLGVRAHPPERSRSAVAQTRHARTSSSRRSGPAATTSTRSSIDPDVTFPDPDPTVTFAPPTWAR